jgi:hypothetical protein
MQVGDRVKIVRRATDEEMEEIKDAWVEDMDEFVGRIGVVDGIERRSSSSPDAVNVFVKGTDEFNGWFYPKAVLELVED